MNTQTTHEGAGQKAGQPDWQQAVAALRAATGRLPEDPEQLLRLGQAYLEGRLVGPAEECFQAALLRDPELSRAHYFLGFLYSRQGRYREATLAFGKCLAAQPRNDLVYAELGLVYFKQGQLREARALWQQGLMLAKEEARLVQLLEHMSYSVKLDGEERVVPNLCRMASLAAGSDLGLALSYLERAQGLESFNPAVFVTYAQVFGAGGKTEEAEAAWAEAIRLSPCDPALQADFAQFMLACGKHKEARVWAERAVTLAPSEPNYWLILARAEEQAGNTAAAEQHLKKAHELDPEQPTINYELGHLLWQEKKIPPALCYLRKAARAGHEEARVYLASLCQATKRRAPKKTVVHGGGSAVEQTAY